MCETIIIVSKGVHGYSTRKLYENQEQNGENSDYMESDSMTLSQNDSMIIPQRVIS